MGLRRARMLAGMGLCIGLWGLWSVGAAPAEARGPDDDYVPYVPSGFFTFNWSGFYAGGNLGLAHANLEATETIHPNNFFLQEILSYDQSETSVIGGLQAGWQKHWGKLVWGAEVGISLLRFDATTESPLIDGLSRSVEVGDILALTGKLGYADGRWLAYFKAGLVNADISISYHDAVAGLTGSSSSRETGWTAGLGMDYALTQSLFLGIEYNYLHFNADVSPPFIPDLPTQFGDAELDVQYIVIRLNYRFQPQCCPGGGGP